MAADTAALAIAARIWPGAAVTLEELSGGLTNLNYKATTPSGTFVIRLFGRDAGLLAIDRETEQAATSMAVRRGGDELGRVRWGDIERDGQADAGQVLLELAESGRE